MYQHILIRVIAVRMKNLNNVDAQKDPQLLCHSLPTAPRGYQHAVRYKPCKYRIKQGNQGRGLQCLLQFKVVLNIVFS